MRHGRVVPSPERLKRRVQPGTCVHLLQERPCPRREPLGPQQLRGDVGSERRATQRREPAAAAAAALAHCQRGEEACDVKKRMVEQMAAFVLWRAAHRTR